MCEATYVLNTFEGLRFDVIRHNLRIKDRLPPTDVRLRLAARIGQLGLCSATKFWYVSDMFFLLMSIMKPLAVAGLLALAWRFVAKHRAEQRRRKIEARHNSEAIANAAARAERLRASRENVSP